MWTGARRRKTGCARRAGSAARCGPHEEGEVVLRAHLPGRATAEEDPRRLLPEEREPGALDPQDAPLPQPHHVDARVGFDELQEALLPGLADVALGVDVEVVRVDLEPDQARRLEGARL